MAEEGKRAGGRPPGEEEVGAGGVQVFLWPGSSWGPMVTVVAVGVIVKRGGEGKKVGGDGREY